MQVRDPLTVGTFAQIKGQWFMDFMDREALPLGIAAKSLVTSVASLCGPLKFHMAI